MLGKPPGLGGPPALLGCIDPMPGGPMAEGCIPEGLPLMGCWPEPPPALSRAPPGTGVRGW